MNTINNEILSAIDKIETVTLESEMHVLTAICDAYEKSAVILENYEGEDLSCFDIFQEGFKDDVKEAFKGKNGEHIVKKILMVIPRLLAAIGKAIKRFFNKKKDQQVINNLTVVKRSNFSSDETRQVIQIVSDEINKDKPSTEELFRNLEKSLKDAEKYAALAEELSKALKSLNSLTSFHEGPRNANNETMNNIGLLLLPMCENKTIKTTLRLEDVSRIITNLRDMLNDMNKVFDGPDHLMEKGLSDIIYKYRRDPIWNIYDDRNDVRRYLSFSKPKEYTIDEACSFIKGKSEALQYALSIIDDLVKSLNGVIKRSEEFITRQNAYKERHKDDVDYVEKVALSDEIVEGSKKEIQQFQTMLRILQSSAKLIPNLLIIIETETATWNEAAKIALGLSLKNNQ